jgi:hypothetical protein
MQRRRLRQQRRQQVRIRRQRAEAQRVERPVGDEGGDDECSDQRAPRGDEVQ